MANINDVAKKAGVAISTVSYIINGTRNVSPEITERVMKAIDELDYQIDPIARSMRNGSSRMIGLIITSFSRIFFAPVIRRCREIASSQGYTLMCVETDDDFELEKNYIDLMRGNRFDAIILDTVADLDDSAYYEKLQALAYRKKRIPVVCIERDMTEFGLDSVEADNYNGAVKALNHLISLGSKKIMHITGPANSFPAERRMRGFKETIEKHPEVEQLVVAGDFSPKSGYDAVCNTLVKRNELPFDAVFASNDQMAVGAIKALQEMGVSIPDEVKVVGFDDSFIASLLEPSLTSVHVSAAGIGTVAIRLALERISNVDQPARCRQVDTGLVVRQSTDKDTYISKNFSNW